MATSQLQEQLEIETAHFVWDFDFSRTFFRKPYCVPDCVKNVPLSSGTFKSNHL